MYPEEKYDNIINTIERIIQENPYMDHHSIMEHLFKELGYTERDLPIIMRFFTGLAPAEYIKKRKMNYSYKELKKMEKFDMDKVIEYTQCGDHPSYIKAFRKEFETSPKKAFNDTKNLYQEPLTFEQLHEQTIETKEEMKVVEEKIFGVDKEKFEDLISANGYKELYGFNLSQANRAYELSQKYRVPVKDTFAFIDDYCMYIQREYAVGKNMLNEEIFTKEIDKAFVISYEYDISVSEVMQLRDEFAGMNFELFDQKGDLLDLYMNGHLPLREFMKNYQFYCAHKDQFEKGEVEDFLLSAETYDCETAMDIIISFRTIATEPYIEDPRNEEDVRFKDYWEDAEHQDFYGNEYHDDLYNKEYDPDNPEY